MCIWLIYFLRFRFVVRSFFLHIYEPDVDIFAVPVSPILHLGLVADVFRTTSMTMLTTVIVQLT